MWVWTCVAYCACNFFGIVLWSLVCLGSPVRVGAVLVCQRAVHLADEQRHGAAHGEDAVGGEARHARRHQQRHLCVAGRTSANVVLGVARHVLRGRRRDAGCRHGAGGYPRRDVPQVQRAIRSAWGTNVDVDCGLFSASPYRSLQTGPVRETL